MNSSREDGRCDEKFVGLREYTEGTKSGSH